MHGGRVAHLKMSSAESRRGEECGGGNCGAAHEDVLERLEGDPAGGALGDGHEGDDAELGGEAAEGAGDAGEEEGGAGAVGGGGAAGGEGVHGELEEEGHGEAEALGEDEHDEGGGEARAELDVCAGRVGGRGEGTVSAAWEK